MHRAPRKSHCPCLLTTILQNFEQFLPCAIIFLHCTQGVRRKPISCDKTDYTRRENKNGSQRLPDLQLPAFSE